MKRLLYLLFTSLILVACPDPVVSPVIKLDSSQSTLMTISAKGESFDVVFTSALEWEAGVSYTDGSGWVSIDKTSGVGEYAVEKIRVTVSANNQDKSRSAKLVISSNGIKKEVSFTQKPGEAEEEAVFDVLTGSANVGASGGTVKVTVRYNVEYECKITDDWIKEVDTKAYDQKVHTFVISANETTVARSATISFCGNGTCLPFVVNQAAGESEPEPEPYLNVDTDNLSMPAEESSMEVAISSNVEWKATCSADWVNLSPASGNGDEMLTVSVAENTNEEVRTADIKVKDASGTLSCTIKVKQQAAEEDEEEVVFELTESSAEVSAEEGTIKVIVHYNVSYECQVDVDWIKEVKAKAYDEAIHTFVVYANETTEERTGTITFIGNDTSIPFTVTQAGKEAEPYLLISSQNVSLPAYATKQTINITSNVDWKVSCTESWVTLSPMSGKGDAKLDIVVTANERKESRKAVVKINDVSGKLSHSIQVNQEGADIESILSIDKESIAADYTGIQTPVTVNVTSNTAWTVESNSSWCIVSPASGTDDGSFNIKVSENTTTSSRNALITVKSVDDPSLYRKISVYQEAKPEAEIGDSWKTSEFEHKSLFMMFTADWCGDCPNMATSIALAQENMPGKIEALSIHSSGNLACAASESIVPYYKISELPSGLVDGRTSIDNYSSTYAASLIEDAVNDTESRYDTYTGASWTSTVSDNALYLNIVTYIKKAGSYKVTALLVEDNIVGYQEDNKNGSSNSYIHNGVVRGAFSDALGESFNISSANQIKRFNYSVTIPSGCNKNNLKIVVYVQRSDSGSYYVDNVASSKVGVKKDLAIASGVEGGNEDLVPGDDIIF